MNTTLSSPVWLFDLDNTLHNASHAIFPAIVANMNLYIARVLGDGITPASDAAVDAARTQYWRRYGATLLGMVKHHQVPAAHFLSETHAFTDLPSMIRAERGLGALLRRLPGRARRVDDGVVGRRHAIAEHARNIGVHIGRDEREDGVRGVVQGVVEVEQPDGRGAIKMEHGHESL